MPRRFNSASIASKTISTGMLQDWSEEDHSSRGDQVFGHANAASHEDAG
jgi:hypothetical protein